MRRYLLILLLFVTVGAVARIETHDGHGEKLTMMGTIKTVLPQRIEIETFDQAMMQFKRVWVITDVNTRYVRAKKRLDAEAAQPLEGERVVAVVSSEHTADNSLRLIGLQIELSARKK